MTTVIDAQALRGLPVIIGAGVAGLIAALSLDDTPCVLVSAAQKPGVGVLTSGIARALGADQDVRNRADATLRHAAGMASLEVVQRITDAMPRIIGDLARYGIALAPGHHDTGYAFHAALLAAIRARPRIKVIAPATLQHLIVVDGRVCGVRLDVGGHAFALDTNRVILASGGACGLYKDNLAPISATGAGMAIAARAGAVLSDLEFVHFHPLCLSLGETQVSGISIPLELCDRGATLYDDRGQHLPVDLMSPASLARDIMTRRSQGREVFVDLRKVVSGSATDTPETLAALVAFCRAHGYDPAAQALPVQPGAAFQIGGIRTDVVGRTSLPGLWACGEVACTGFHGASIHPDNPLLEAVVCSRLAAENVASTPASSPCDLSALYWDKPNLQMLIPMVRTALTGSLNLIREPDAMLRDLVRLSRFVGHDDPALIASMMLLSALRRKESRGDHFRADYPQMSSILRHTALNEQDLRATLRAVELNHVSGSAPDIATLNTSLGLHITA